MPYALCPMPNAAEAYLIFLRKAISSLNTTGIDITLISRRL